MATLEKLMDNGLSLEEAQAKYNAMDNLNKAFYGGMKYEEAIEAFKKLTTEEALEMLEEDIESTYECYLRIEYPSIKYLNYSQETGQIKIDKEAGTLTIEFAKNHHYLKVDFTTCEVSPSSDYDTSEWLGESYNDSKEYCLHYEGYGDDEAIIEIQI